jgi:hypothetical protein
MRPSGRAMFKFPHNICFKNDCLLFNIVKAMAPTIFLLKMNHLPYGCTSSPPPPKSPAMTNMKLKAVQHGQPQSLNVNHKSVAHSWNVKDGVNRYNREIIVIIIFFLK